MEKSNEFTLERFLAILAFVSTIATTAATVLQIIRPAWAVYALALSAAISAFTVKVQTAK